MIAGKFDHLCNASPQHLEAMRGVAAESHRAATASLAAATPRPDAAHATFMHETPAQTLSRTMNAGRIVAAFNKTFGGSRRQ